MADDVVVRLVGGPDHPGELDAAGLRGLLAALQLLTTSRHTPPPVCEGRLHPEGTQGHDDGPAAHAVTWQCNQCGDNGILRWCEGRLRWILASPVIECGSCGAVHLLERFIYAVDEVTAR